MAYMTYTILAYVSISWLIALFTRTPVAGTVAISLHKVPVVPYVLVCPLCLGWYLGFSLGCRDYIVGSDTFGQYHPFIVAFIISFFSYVCRILLDAFAFLHEQFLRSES